MSEMRMDSVVQRIAEKYPRLFSPDSGCWHDCPPGWEALVVELCERLATGHPNVRCVQCKRKFGTLRFYLSEGASQEAVALVREYEVRSARMCERCARHGEQVKGRHGWISTLCAEHAAEKLPGV